MSTLRSAIDALLQDGTLDEFVTGRRDRGVSWRRIALDLHGATGVDVTHETLRAWYPDRQEAS